MELPVLTGRGVMTNLGVGFVWTKEEGGGVFFHASLANICNKCHKKTVFRKTIEFGI